MITPKWNIRTCKQSLKQRLVLKQLVTTDSSSTEGPKDPEGLEGP